MAQAFVRFKDQFHLVSLVPTFFPGVGFDANIFIIGAEVFNSFVSVPLRGEEGCPLWINPEDVFIVFAVIAVETFDYFWVGQTCFSTAAIKLKYPLFFIPLHISIYCFSLNF